MKFIVTIISYAVWSMLIGFVAWFACKVNGTMINYWSIVLASNFVYLLAAPMISVAKKE
jgi:hypothetical protein